MFFWITVLSAQPQSKGITKRKGWDRIGNKLATGVIGAIKDNVQIKDSDIESGAYHTAHGFTEGVIAGVKDSIRQADIDKVIDHLGTKAAENLVKMRDSLLHMDDPALTNSLLQWAGKLREELLGAGLDLDVKNLIATILSNDTELRTRKFVRGIIDEGLSPVTSKSVANLIDSAGIAVNRQAAKITDTLFEHLQHHLKSEEDKIQVAVHPYFLGLIITGTLFFLTAVILAYIFHRKTKYEKLTGVLTYEIHQSQPQYFNDLAERIRATRSVLTSNNFYVGN